MFQIFANGELLYLPGDPYKAVASPMMTIEMGKAGSLSCDLPPINNCYWDIANLKTKIVCKQDDDIVFRGRVLSNENNVYNIKTIYCEGALSYLVDSVQKISAYTGTTHQLFHNIISRHNERVDPDKRFIVGRITVENRDIVIKGQSDEEGDDEYIDYEQIAIDSMTNDWDTTLDVIDSCLIDYCGGYLSVRPVGDDLYIDYLADDGPEIDQEIRCGVNLIDLTDERNVEDFFTVLIPLGNDNLTIESVNGGSDEIVDEAAVSEYGRIVRTHVFDSVNDANTLLENGRRYMQLRKTINRTITITALDIHFMNPDISPIHVGDRVRIYSIPHGISDIFTCTKIDYDLENPENTEYTFGKPKQTLTQRYHKNKIESAKAAVSAAAASGGGSGGRAQKKLEEELENFYKEWVDIDPNNPDGIISLGTLYDHVVQSTVAINGKVDENHAMLELHAIHISETSESLALIEERTDTTESNIQILTEYTKDNDKNIASIILNANEQGSAIDVNADRIALNASEIVEINSDLVTMRLLIADEIEAVRAEIGYAVTGSISAKDVTTTGNAWIGGTVITPTVSAGNLNLGGSAVSKTSIPVVTEFTQAFGQTAPTTNMTFLTTEIGAVFTWTPLLGTTVKF